jgi:hypothetical protein
VPVNFDPYHAWLGIAKGARPVNHYQLLGLANFTSEPPVIAEAAEERAEKVQAHVSGEHADAARRVLAEIQAARSVLLSPASRKAYDAELRRQLGMPPAAAPAAPVAAAAAPAAAPVAAAPVAAPVRATPVAATPVVAQAVPVTPRAVAVPMTAAPVQPMAAVPVGGFAPAATGPSFGLDEEQHSRRRRRRSSSSGTLALVGVAIVVLGLFGAVCFIYRETLLAAIEGRPPETIVIGETPPPDKEKVPAVKTPEEKKGTTEKNTKEPKAPVVEPPTDSGLPPLVVAPGVAQNAAQRVMSGPMRPMNDGMPEAMVPKRPAPKVKVQPKPVMPASKPATAEEKAAVAESLAAARAALGERNFKKASEQLDLALLEASSTETQTSVQRMQSLDEAVRAFWKAIGQRLAEMKPVDQLSVNGKEMVVVNVEPELFSVRFDGQTVEYSLTKPPTAKGALPVDMALWLAQDYLQEGDPNTKILVGAFLAVDPNGDRGRAQQLWQEASSQPGNVAKDLLELDLTSN